MDFNIDTSAHKSMECLLVLYLTSVIVYIACSFYSDMTVYVKTM